MWAVVEVVGMRWLVCGYVGKRHRICDSYSRVRVAGSEGGWRAHACDAAHPSSLQGQDDECAHPQDAAKMDLALKSVGTMSGAARAVKAEVASALVRPLKGQASARSPLIRPLLCCTSRWICDTVLRTCSTTTMAPDPPNR